MRLRYVLALSLMSLLLIGTATAYICINFDDDNTAVQNFKNRLNLLTLQHDLENNMTIEGIYYKMKYLNPCEADK